MGDGKLGSECRLSLAVNRDEDDKTVSYGGRGGSGRKTPCKYGEDTKI